MGEAGMLKAISLYTGVGGLDFGMEAAGFETVAAVEMDRASCRTIELNRPWAILPGDIHDISSHDILGRAGIGVGEADVLIAGPPCQPFSKSSYWVSGDTLRLDDPRASTLAAFLRVLRDTKPRAFLLENVPGLAYETKSEGLELLLNGIAQVNREAKTRYSAHWSVLNAAAYGVPQARERLFLVGSRDGTPFRFPAPTHSDPEPTDMFDAQREPFRTAWDAIGDLSKHPEGEAGLTVNGRWGALLPSIPEGQNYLWHTNRRGGRPLFGWRTRYWSFLLKLAKNRPSWTLQAKPGPYIGPFHWANRRLTTAEMCRIQTFPDGLRFESGRSDVQRMLGNAVPSLLTEILGREMRAQILGAPLRDRKLKLLLPRRTPIPRAERVADVSPEFLYLEGAHPDHPGTGKGRRAQTLFAVGAREEGAARS